MITEAPDELVLRTGPAANGGSCIARHDGRVVFVRYALPENWCGFGSPLSVARTGTLTLSRCLSRRMTGSSRCVRLPGWTAPVAVIMSFIAPAAARKIKGHVVANQLARLGDYAWEGVAEPIGSGNPQGWRTRVRLDVGADGRAGFHRYHSSDLVTDLRCGQLPEDMLAGLEGARWRSGDHLHVVLDDDERRHVATTTRGRRGSTTVEGAGDSVQRVGQRVWKLPVTGFWQSHRDAPAFYSALVRQWAQGSDGVRAWDLYGGVGLFAAVLAEVVGEGGHVLSVDTSRSASATARSALADLPQVQVVSDSVRRVLSSQSGGADIAVLDPPRAERAVRSSN